jgi:hypothetical protein
MSASDPKRTLALGGDMAGILIIATAFILVVLNTVATRTVVSGDFPKRQKMGQCLLIWLMPFAGAILVLALDRDSLRGGPDHQSVDDSLLDTVVKSAPFDHAPPGADDH